MSDSIFKKYTDQFIAAVSGSGWNGVNIFNKLLFHSDGKGFITVTSWAMELWKSKKRFPDDVVGAVSKTGDCWQSFSVSEYRDKWLCKLWIFWNFNCGNFICCADILRLWRLYKYCNRRGPLAETEREHSENISIYWLYLESADCGMAQAGILLHGDWFMLFFNAHVR